MEDVPPPLPCTFIFSIRSYSEGKEKKWPEPRSASDIFPHSYLVWSKSTQKHKITESWNSLGWKGPSKVTQSNPSATSGDIFH